MLNKSADALIKINSIIINILGCDS